MNPTNKTVKLAVTVTPSSPNNAIIPLTISVAHIANIPFAKARPYYGKRFTCKKELVEMIENYIRYYNNQRVQRNLGVLTPMEKHDLYLAA